MDEKTAELRDIFLDVAEEETVTESQEASRGSVADAGETDEERLAAAVAEMREKFAFGTDCSDGEYVELVERFFDGDDDGSIATALSVPPEVVFRARMDLHLVRDDDPPGVEVDDGTWGLVREQNATVDGELDVETLAAETGLEEATVERVCAVVDATARSRRVSNRFRTTFEECVSDADLRTRLAADAHRDGLADATEDAEVDVDF